MSINLVILCVVNGGWSMRIDEYIEVLLINDEYCILPKNVSNKLCV